MGKKTWHSPRLSGAGTHRAPAKRIQSIRKAQEARVRAGCRTNGQAASGGPPLKWKHPQGKSMCMAERGSVRLELDRWSRTQNPWQDSGGWNHASTRGGVRATPARTRSSMRSIPERGPARLGARKTDASGRCCFLIPRWATSIHRRADYKGNRELPPTAHCAK
jgi:hypothetical protein